MSETERRGAERPRRSILDFNSSWPLMVVYIGYLVGIHFAQRATFSLVGGDKQYAYFLIPLILGLLVTVICYNLFKILFAHLSGYQIRYLEFLGFCFDHSGAKRRFHYDVTKFFDVSLRFYPKDDDLTKNPRKMFLGGLIGEALVAALAILLFFLLSFHKTASYSVIGWGALFGFAYGFVIILYEMIPLRQDVATDIFNFMKTKKKDDQKAFNLILVNKRRELQGLDFLVPDFQDYDSYYKAQTLYYLYLSNLYDSKLEASVKNLDEMKYFLVDFPENEKYVGPAEYIYLRYLIDDEQGADKLYLSLKSDDKAMVRKPTTLSDYRSALFVAAFIQKSKEKIDSIVKQHDALLASYPETSRRLTKEKELFDEVYQKIKTKLPELGLSDRN